MAASSPYVRVPPRVLTIAGSDSSGGAGIEADLKVIAAHECYGMTSITALTAQNTQGVLDIHEVPPEFLRKEIAAVLDDIGADVIKTGMLAGAQSIRVVVEMLKKYGIEKTVIDPVMVSTSGHQLLPGAAVSYLITHLLPLTYILTPNLPEARLLLESSNSSVPSEIDNIHDAIEIARALHKLGPKYILLKGGHSPYKKVGKYDYWCAKTEEEREVIVDVLFDGNEAVLIASPYIHSQNTHGTGCSLASAIASNLAHGYPTTEVVRRSIKYVSEAIRTSAHTTINLGKGTNKPINHLHTINLLPFLPGNFVEYALNHPKVRDVWREYTEHEFVKKLGDGTLEPERFRWYLIQDYLFLIQFARANSLAAYKSKNIDDISKAASIVLHIQREMALHIEYCKGFGISKEEMENSIESQACTAYTRFVLDIGHSQDFFALQIAMAPCLIGYGQIGKTLYNSHTTKKGPEGNIYWKWIENYGASEDYQEAVRVGRELLEKYAARQSRERIEELVEVWAHATRMERGFWTMGLNGPQ